jgi:hypothetical protein
MLADRPLVSPLLPLFRQIFADRGANQSIDDIRFFASSASLKTAE